jgi:hypothetical protein
MSYLVDDFGLDDFLADGGDGHGTRLLVILVPVAEGAAVVHAVGVEKVVFRAGGVVPMSG